MSRENLPHNLDIRPFRSRDQAAARRLILSGLQERWGHLDETKNPDLDDIAAAYAGGLFLVAYRGERLVATGALLAEGEGVGRIVRMSVARDVRRRGVGRRMLQALLEAARARGYGKVALETTATWADAVAFYRREGFRSLGIRHGDMHFEKEL